MPVALVVLTLLQARDSTTPYSHAAAPVIRAARAAGPIRIDGRLDEPDWAAAEPVGSFTQLDPHEGAPATERTEVRVLIGGDALTPTTIT